MKHYYLMICVIQIYKNIGGFDYALAIIKVIFLFIKEIFLHCFLVSLSLKNHNKTKAIRLFLSLPCYCSQHQHFLFLYLFGLSQHKTLTYVHLFCLWSQKNLLHHHEIANKSNQTLKNRAAQK